MGKPMLIQGENLILAGDITVLRCLNPYMTDSGNKKTRDRTELFFKNMLENFKRVFYLTGNHESYNFNIQLEREYIAKYLPDVIHLDDSVYEFDDGETVLLGGTLWTDMDGGNENTMRAVEYGMNDFRIIYHGQDDVWTARLAREKHLKTMEFLRENLEKYKDKKVVVATHHAPTPRLINIEHTKSGAINHGYYTDLEEFIREHPQIKYWIAGHTHRQDQFPIGETMVVSNAKGYEGYERSAETFNPDTYFDL